MTFGAAAFLFAGLAGIVPVILHMISHQKAKELPFSTLRFLRISVEKTRRRRRIQDLFLMLLRVAALVLIAIGLAKPTLTNLSTLFGGGAQAAVAVILDNSASMGTEDQGQMRMETAKNAASQIIQELQDGDRVALYLTGGPRFPEEGKLDPTHEKVLQVLNQSTVSYERADLATKVHDARKLLAKSDAPNKQIFVISDLQKLSWESLQKNKKEGAGDADQGENEEEEKWRDVPVIFVDCHRRPKPNVAVTDVEVRTVVPVAGVPVTATVELFNAADGPQQPHVELHVDGNKEATSPALNVPPLDSAKHDLEFTFKTGGLHRGEVRLVGDDGSKLDDRLFFTMEVDQGIPVAIVTAERHEIAPLDDSFYVEQALAPGGTAGWAIRTTRLTIDDLAAEPLADYTVIYCVNLPALAGAAAERLRDYVTGGGNLVWTSGDNVEPEAYNRMNDEAQGQLLPAPLREIRAPRPGDGRDSWNVTFLDKQHRALAPLVEPADLHQSILVYRHARIDAKAAGGAWVLARLDDGEPLLIQRDVEQGKVVMLGTSVHVGWTNLPLRPIFMPLVVRLTLDLADVEQARYRALAGSPIIIPFQDELRPAG
ncbi:MAG: BatA domain-containing protein, partial [Planctomycetota bacterium]